MFTHKLQAVRKNATIPAIIRIAPPALSCLRITTGTNVGVTNNLQSWVPLTLRGSLCLLRSSNVRAKELDEMKKEARAFAPASFFYPKLTPTFSLPSVFWALLLAFLLSIEASCRKDGNW